MPKSSWPGYLLVGILIGIGVKLVIHLANGVPIRSLFLPYMDVEVQDNTGTVHAHHSAVFSNWILFRRKLVQLGLVDGMDVVLDLSKTKLVDHSVMEKLHELEQDFEREGRKLEIRGLDEHAGLSNHPLAARKLPQKTA